MQRLYIFALSAVGMMCLVAAFFAPTSDLAKPAIAAVAKPVAEPESEALLLLRDGSGQFHLTAKVNGNEAEFLVDTGADVVALTEEEAQQLGLGLSPRDFAPMMQTASGVANGAAVRLNELEVAGVLLHDVDAVVVQGLTSNLLGQSVLRQLGGIELKGDKMVINPR